jgi:hypothetical protein
LGIATARHLGAIIAMDSAVAAPPALFTYSVTPSIVPYTQDAQHPSVVALTIVV